MKKKLAVFLLLTVLLSLLPACGNEEIPDGPTELWVVTEQTEKYGMNEQAEMLIKQFQKIYDNVTVRLDILPTNKEERAVYLDSIRTQIMGGGGPDVFLMPTAALTYPGDDGLSTNSMEPLFRDVTQQMYNGIFADISEYYDADDTLGKEALVTAVMDAGTLDSARYLLPLRYTYSVLLADNAAVQAMGVDASALEGRIDELFDLCIQLNDSKAAYGLSFTASYNWFDNYVNYETGEVLLQAQEVAALMEKYNTARSLRTYSIDDTFQCVCDIFGYINENTFFSDNGYPFCGSNLSSIIETAATIKMKGADVTMIPVRSTDGSLIADVTYYGAVGAGCKNPKLAYEFLRLFLSEQAQWEQYKPRNFHSQIRGLVEEGFPVRTVGSVEALYENVRSRLETMQNSVTNVRSGARMRQRFINDSFTLTDEDIPILSQTIDEARFPIIMEFEDSIRKYFSWLENSSQIGSYAQQTIDDLKIYLYEG